MTPLKRKNRNWNSIQRKRLDSTRTERRDKPILQQRDLSMMQCIKKETFTTTTRIRKILSSKKVRVVRYKSRTRPNLSHVNSHSTINLHMDRKATIYLSWRKRTLLDIWMFSPLKLSSLQRWNNFKLNPTSFLELVNRWCNWLKDNKVMRTYSSKRHRIMVKMPPTSLLSIKLVSLSWSHI